MTEQEKQILKDLFETEPQIKRTYQYAVNNKDAEMLKHIEKFVKSRKTHQNWSKIEKNRKKFR